MAWDVTSDLLRFDEALEWFLSRMVISTEELAALEAQAASSAFWVANVAEARVVQDTFDSLARALERGETFSQWQKVIGDELHNAWSLRGGAEANRMQVIYRNATQGAYNRGRHKQMSEPLIKELRPQWMFDGIGDSRQSAICRECDGTIRPHDDPWWDSHTPQLHHACRSGIRCLTDEQAREKLGSGATNEDGTKRFSNVAPDVDAADGFGDAPKPSDDPKDDFNLDTLDPALRKSLDGKAAAAGE